jgi:hypothetical protein
VNLWGAHASVARAEVLTLTERTPEMQGAADWRDCTETGTAQRSHGRGHPETAPGSPGSLAGARSWLPSGLEHASAATKQYPPRWRPARPRATDAPGSGRAAHRIRCGPRSDKAGRARGAAGPEPPGRGLPEDGAAAAIGTLLRSSALLGCEGRAVEMSERFCRMSSERKKQYQRKRPLRPLPPSAADDLLRWIRVLRRLRARGVSRAVWGSVLRGPGDDPLGELIACLKRVLEGHSAAEVFDPKRRSGRRRDKQDIHIAISAAYWRVRGSGRSQGKVIRYPLSPAEACALVRTQRKEWEKYTNNSIRRWAHKYRDWPVDEFTPLDP